MATLDPLRFHKHYDGSSPYAGGSSFMERVSEAVASGMGTVAFLVVSSAIIFFGEVHRATCQGGSLTAAAEPRNGRS